MSAPTSIVWRSTPPTSERALPIDETVTSSREPGRANGGRLAVTSTAATFFSRSCVVSIWMPSRRISVISDSAANGACVVSSPVPERPVTTP